jgi:hypothetical protein
MYKIIFLLIICTATISSSQTTTVYQPITNWHQSNYQDGGTSIWMIAHQQLYISIEKQGPYM